MRSPKGPVLAVTPGDPDGIGPEIVWKTLPKSPPRAQLLCVGAREPFDRMGVPVREVSLDDLRPARGTLQAPASRTPYVWLLKAPSRAPRGKLLPGYQSGWAIEQAVSLVQSGLCQALVTGPISKERLQKGGYLYPGHTELLAKLCKTPQVTMMLANDALRVTLVTTHLGIRGVSRALRQKDIEHTARQTIDSLRSWWGIRTPRVAILGLNPHAGEGGLFGREELDTIRPAIQALQKSYGSRARITGPHPADTFFAQHIGAPARERHDAVVCMYHDQGLIPVKLIDFARTVNVTLGLPILRTSVDHGTGFDIAGKGIADPSSFQAAVSLAIRISAQRRKGN